MDPRLPPEALARKARSESVLREQGVPVNPNLPVVETESESTRRTTEDVAHRALALHLVAVKGQGLAQATVNKAIADFGLAPFFTEKEQTFVRSDPPSQRDRVEFSWRYEALWTLHWALGFVDTLGKPVALCDVPLAVAFILERSTAEFVRDAKLRPQSEILDQADIIYRYHWAVRDALLKGRDAPTGLDSGVVLERHHALNWLVGYLDQEWDDVTTDT